MKDWEVVKPFGIDSVTIKLYDLTFAGFVVETRITPFALMVTTDVSGVSCVVVSTN